MGFKRDLQSALAAVAAALGLDFVSGRALAAFYAQTAQASWAGVFLSGLLFGALAGAISSLARRTGSVSISMLFRRLPGGGTGGFTWMLYCLLMFAACCMLLGEANHIGALMLPVKRAGALAAGIAALLAAVLALSSRGCMRAVGSVFVLLMLLFEAGLLFFAEPLKEPLLYELELHLCNNLPAALLFALLHTCVGICLSAAVIVRLSDGSTHPARFGIFAGAAMLILLLAGNAVLQSGSREMLALKLPFVALSGGWGSIGFYISALMMLAASVLSLSGILQGIFAEKRS